MRLITHVITGSLILSALFFTTSCRDRPAEMEENTGYHDAVRNPAAKGKTDTRHSENQAEPKDGSPDETINIGLILSSQVTKSELSQAASHGAELAIQQANRAGGFDHRHFRLLVRSCDGPWGMAAKEAVSLITEYGVTALLTSLDGRNAHLIEQVATKAKVTMLSARAGDPTLSQAFVPWYFRCVSNDNQHAEALTDELVKRRKSSEIIVISENSYDGRLASVSFMKQLAEKEVKMPDLYRYDMLNPDFDSIIMQIKKTGIQHFVLFGGPENSLQLIKKLSETMNKFTIYGPFSIIGEKNTLKEFLDCADNTVLTSADFWFTPQGKEFQKAFQETYGYLPGPAAAFAYDGMNMLIEAIKKGDLEQEEMVNSLVKIKYKGVTGTIQFDDKGNRKGNPGIMRIQHGIPVSFRESN